MPTAQSERLEWEARSVRQSPAVQKAWQEVRALRRKARSLERAADRAYEAAALEWEEAEEAAWTEAEEAWMEAEEKAEAAGWRAWRLERRQVRETELEARAVFGR